MKILLFKIGAMGDTLMTTPLVRQLRGNYPQAQIDYLVGKQSARLLDGNKNLDNIAPFDEEIFTKRQIKRWFALIKSIRTERYDLIFVLDKHWIFNLTARLSGIKQRVGFNRYNKERFFLTDKVYYGKIRHDIFCYLDLAKKIGLKVDYHDFGMDIPLSKEDLDFADKFWKEHQLENKRTIGISPGGGNNPGQVLQEKILPISHYIKLIKHVKEPVLLFGGPSDKIKEEQILKECPNTISTIGKSSLKQSLAIMQKCDKLICNDSGPMHMSAAVNKNVISIFGPVHPKRKAPLWKESKYIWKAEHLYNAKNETYGTFLSQDYFPGFSYEEILRLL